VFGWPWDPSVVPLCSGDSRLAADTYVFAHLPLPPLLVQPCANRTSTSVSGTRFYENLLPFSPQRPLVGRVARYYVASSSSGCDLTTTWVDSARGASLNGLLALLYDRPLAVTATSRSILLALTLASLDTLLVGTVLWRTFHQPHETLWACYLSLRGDRQQRTKHLTNHQ